MTTNRAFRQLRRALPPLRVAYRRTAARLGPVVLVAIGIGLAAGALAAILTARVVVADRAVADAIAAFPPDQRSVSVSWIGTETASLSTLDREARRTVDSFGMGQPTRAVVYRTTRIGSENVRVAALDDLDDLVDLRSGRAPEPCSARSCELVALDAPTRPLEAAGFEVVGQVTGKADAPLDGLVGSRAPGERLLLANGVERVLRRPLFARLFRTVTWLVPLDPNAFEATTLDDFERRVEQENTRLRLRSPGFGVRAPVEELTAAGEQAERASRRQLLVAGQFIALFVAFAVLAASRIRRDARETQYRLRRFGALRWQVLVEATAHAAVVAVPAALLGWFGGVAAGAVIAAAADRSVSSALERSSLSAFGLQAALGLSVIAVAAIVVTVRARSVEIRGLRVTVADVAAAGAVAVVVAAFGTGQHDAASTNGTGTLLLLLPVLIAFAGAVVAARLLGPAFRFGEHVSPKTSVAVRLALLSLVRSPGPATLAVVFLVVTAGLAVFAGTYRATLGAHHRDTAAYAVPLDYVVSRDAVRSRALGAPAPLSDHYGGQRAVGVVRRPGEAPTLNRTERLTVLGVPAAALERLHWRDDYAERSRMELAAAISFGRAAELRGIDIPSGTREVVFPLRVRGEPIQLVAHFRRPNGSFAALALRESRTPSVRTVRLPQGVAGGRLVALTLQFPPATAFTAAHRATGTRAAPDVFVRGMLTLRRPVARGATGVRPLAVDYRDWVQADGSGVGRSPTSLTLRYLLTRERVSRVRPRQVTDERPLPVIASASLAAAAGEGTVLPLDVGGADIRVRLAATADRFPTTRGDFVVAGRDALETALNSAAPGVAVADEVWLEGPRDSETHLRRGAPVPVRVVSRAALEDRLRADPVSRASSLALIAGALVALALALAGILLALAIDLRDEAAELFDLEALGLPPAGLARHVWLRSVAVVLLGIAGGLATGAVIAFVVSDVVEVTSGAEAAEPPLLLATDWPGLLAGLVAFTAIALGSAAILARGAFRAAAPARGYLR